MARRPGFTSHKDVTLLGLAVPKAEAPETPQVCNSISHAVVNQFLCSSRVRSPLLLQESVGIISSTVKYRT